MFTAHAEQDLLWEALDAGAQGFVLKDSESGALVGAIRQVVAGDPYVDPRLRPGLPAPARAAAAGRRAERAASARSCRCSPTATRTARSPSAWW